MNERAMNELQEIRSLTSGYMPGADLQRVEDVLELARVESGGDPSVLAAAMRIVRPVCRLKLDVPSICAAIALAMPPGPDGGPSTRGLDEDSARLAEGVIGLGRFQLLSSKSGQAEAFKRMLVALAGDIRVLLVKMAMRLAELHQTSDDPGAEQIRVAEEAMMIYGPLAERMGISWLRTEIEDEAFRVMRPTEYASLKLAADRRLAERQEFIAGVVGRLQAMIVQGGLAGFEVFGRQKNLYGIWKKMQIQGIELEQVYDFVAFRVIVQKPGDCWQVLGLVHDTWTPIPARFKDFINVPKPNGYRSLHTSVFGPLGEPMEIQIRTWEMHREAESGIAAHWSYKESGRIEVRDSERLGWMKQVVEWAREIQSGRETEQGPLIEEAREGLLVDQVFVFTPQGDLRVLRQGATCLDFAYDVHTEVGHSCTGVRVNGRLVPLSTELVSGDVVEVMTSRTARPRRDWLNFVVSSKARAKIRSWFLEQDRREALEVGRQLLEKEFRRAGAHVVKYFKELLLDEEKGRKVAESFRIGSRDELIRAVGHGRVSAADVVKAVVPVAAPGVPEPERPEILPKKLRSPTGIEVDGIDGMMVHIARCCNPIPGDGIVGYVTRGRGVTIHTASCRSVLDGDPERVLPATWNSGSGGTFNVPVRITVRDVPGILAGVTTEIGRQGANIAGVSTKRDDSGLQQVDVVLQVADQSMLDGIVRSVRRLRGVVEVMRVRGPGVSAVAERR